MKVTINLIKVNNYLMTVISYLIKVVMGTLIIK